MTPAQEASLVSGGDCFSHFHSEDRRATQDLLHGLQSVAKQTPVSGNLTLAGTEDYLLVDTRLNNVTITLPRAKSGEVEILKLYSPFTITVLPDGTDTVMNTTGVTISVGGAAIHFKAFGTDWRVI